MMDGRSKTDECACDAELRYLLADERGRRFLWRLAEEVCQVSVVAIPHDAEIYALCARQAVGKWLLAACRELDFDSVQRAEREYRALMEKARREMELKKQKGEEEWPTK